MNGISNTAPLSRLEIAEQSFDCCIQIVRSYGPSSLGENERKGLIGTMEHFKSLAKRDISNE